MVELWIVNNSLKCTAIVVDLGSKARVCLDF